MAKKIIKKTSRALAAGAAVKKSAKPAPAKKAAAPAKKPTASGVPAFPPKYDKPLASYSAYAQHRILLEKFGTDEAGQVKVMQHGTDVLGLPVSQVKTYIREKLNAIARDEQKKLGVLPTKPQLEKAKKKDAEFDLDFRFKSRDDAKKHILSVVRRSREGGNAGMLNECFHVLSEDGMYAVVPAHIKPVGKPVATKKGDIVMDITIADSRAEVLEGGPEQSLVHYLTDRSYAAKEQVISNYYLHKLTQKDRPAEVEKPAAPAKKVAKKAAKKAAKK